MIYNGVIFDFNGTLFFDSEKHLLAWRKVAREFGKELSEQELNLHFHGVPNQEGIKYLDNTLSDDEINKYSLLKEQYYRELCLEDTESFHLVDYAYEYFDYLKGLGIPFTIASASIKPNIDFFVQSFHLDSWIDSKNIIYDNGSYKNKVEMFNDAAKTLGTTVEQCLIFEDSKSGIQDAYSAGCRNIIVVDPTGHSSYESLPGVTRVIKDFKELI